MLPMDVVSSWKSKGAKVGWIGIGEFEELNFEEREEGKAGEVPAFKFKVWKAGLLQSVAAPSTEFGLDLGNTKLTDAGMKEVSGLASLHSLDIGHTPVTDLGVKELAALPSLNALNLGFVKVSDVGLKEVCKIRSLKMLVLRGTQTSDLGMEELGSLKGLQSLDLTYVPCRTLG